MQEFIYEADGEPQLHSAGFDSVIEIKVRVAPGGAGGCVELQGSNTIHGGRWLEKIDFTITDGGIRVYRGGKFGRIAERYVLDAVDRIREPEATTEITVTRTITPTSGGRLAVSVA